jgi:OmpA-OmpF porin, OOP family
LVIKNYQIKKLNLMSTFNLLDMAKSYFNNELVSKVSSHLGEDEGGISKAISAIFPSVIGSIADKATHTPDTADAVAKLANAQHEGGILSSITGFLHPDTSHDMLGKSSGLISSIFGNGGASNMLTNLVAGFAGIKSTSVGTILSMAVPTILGLVGRHSAENNLSSNAMATMLGEQKKSAMSMLPEGFNLSSITGGSSSSLSSAATKTYNDAEEKAAGGLKWLLPLLLLAGLAAAAWYFFKDGCNKPAAENTTITTGGDTAHKETTAANTTATVATAAKGTLDSLTGDFMYNEGDITTITLPNNAGELKVGANSTEAKLCAFLNDKTAMIDTAKGNWFEFTNVHFKTGGSDLTDLSAAQLKNMVAISKAYPSATFKFGGYTDNTGNAANNVTLSQKRADAVSGMVVKLGAAATAVAGAKGFGDQYPLGDNATKEGKAMNRRVAVNVKSK